MTALLRSAEARAPALVSALALALALSVLLAPAAAHACATCACGVPTLTATGAEAPFAGRLRLSASMRVWSLSEGRAGVDQRSLREARLDLGAAWAPAPWLFLTALLPVQARELQDVSLARERGLGPGDAELGARLFLWRDRAFSPRHLVSAVAGVKLPTAPLLEDGQGRALGIDAQLGSGSVDPLGGLAYAGFFGDWSTTGAVTGALPTRGFLSHRVGPSVQTAAAVQYQPHPRWAFRLGADMRLSFPGEQGGEPDAVGSGLAVFASPDVLFSPTTDILLMLGVRVPVHRALVGEAAPGPVLAFTLAVDR